MAKEYLEQLSLLIEKLKIEDEIGLSMEVKHFFSGAALYINKTICVTYSPVGIAFKLSPDEVERLISSGKAKPLKYFPKGHIKKGYALFEKPDLGKLKQWKKYFIQTSQNV